jgi:ribonuclease-3
LRKFIQKRVIILYVDISRLEGKVISYKSLVIEWCQKRRIFHYDIYEDNGIDGTRFFGVKLSIDGKVIVKSQSYLKKRKPKKKASQRTYFALQEKWTKIISYSSKLHRFRS